MKIVKILILITSATKKLYKILGKKSIVSMKVDKNQCVSKL